MRLFFKHYAGLEIPETERKLRRESSDVHTLRMQRLIKLNCDEEALDAS
jgi:hypothetical protein